MNRSELLHKIADAHPQLTAIDVERAVKQILDKMSDTLAKGNRIEIRGFGSFELRHRPPRKGRNPKSGVTVRVPATHTPRFKAGKELRERVDSTFTAGCRSNDAI